MSRLWSTIKSFIKRALLLRDLVFSRQFQTGEWSVAGCFEQRGQYTVIDRTDRTGCAKRGAGPSGTEGAVVFVAVVSVLKIPSRASWMYFGRLRMSWWDAS